MVSLSSMQQHGHFQEMPAGFAKPRDLAPFLKTLRRILEVESPDIIRWTPDGRAFEIHDMDSMMREVLPKYFKHRKYTSFQRQLNYFNFRKWTKSKASVCTFSNEFFVRDHPELAYRITRKKSMPTTKVNATKPNSNAVTRHISQAASSTVNSSFPTSTLDSLSMNQQMWKNADMSISIPVKFGGPTSSPLPSPTDVDAVFHEWDIMEPRRNASYPLFYGYHDNSLESFDWIDQIIPSSLAPSTYEDYLNTESPENSQMVRNTQFVFPAMRL